MLFLVCILSMINLVAPHGRLIAPPARSCMWRYGFNTPRNYNDNGLFCGGRARQWENNNGKCGICGDAFDDPPPKSNEAGGIFATGTIAGRYRQGEVMHLQVEVTANHGGYFEFRLCPLLGYMTEANQRCLDRHRLRFIDNRTSWTIPTKVSTNYSMEVQLPPDITCPRCVLQWKWVTANSWGCDDQECCIGCGPQENFVNCADISIGGPDSPKRPKQPTILTEKSIGLMTDGGRDLPLTTPQARTQPVESPSGYQSWMGSNLGIQPQGELQPVLTRERTPQSVVTAHQDALYSNSGSEFSLRPAPALPMRPTSGTVVHSGREYSVNERGSTGRGNQAGRAQSGPSRTSSSSRTGYRDYRVQSEKSTGGTDISLIMLNRLTAALKSKSRRCRLKYRVDGFGMNCGNLCKPVRKQCKSKQRIPVIDAACELMCTSV